MNTQRVTFKHLRLSLPPSGQRQWFKSGIGNKSTKLQSRSLLRAGDTSVAALQLSWAKVKYGRRGDKLRPDQVGITKLTTHLFSGYVDASFVFTVCDCGRSVGEDD